MACSPLRTAASGIVWQTSAAENDPATRLANLSRLLADIAEPAATPDATDLPPDLLEALAAWKTQHRAAH